MFCVIPLTNQMRVPKTIADEPFVDFIQKTDFYLFNYSYSFI